MTDMKSYCEGVISITTEILNLIIENEEEIERKQDEVKAMLQGTKRFKSK